MKPTVFSKVLIVAVAVFMTIGAQAQFARGNSVIDLNHGYSIIGSLDIKFKGSTYMKGNKKYGPLHFRYEYFVTDQFSIGGEMNYRKRDLEFDFKSDFDTVFNYVHFSTSQFRLMGRINYHFVRQPKFDLYGGFALGYVNRSLYIESSLEDYVEKIEDYIGFSNIGIFRFDMLSFFDFPVACRTQIGFRYMPSPYIGVNFEIGGGGGSLFNGGLTFCF